MDEKTRTRRRDDSRYQLQSRRTDDEVPLRPRLRSRPRLFAGADPLPSDEASTDVALQIPKDPRPPSEVLNIRGTASAADQTQEERQQNQIEETGSLQRERSASADQFHEQRERCYKYSQKALVFGFCAFFAYLTPASSSSPSSAGKLAYKFSMAAFFIAVCADLYSWRTKPRDGRTLVYLSSFSLMLMTFLMFISFDSYYGCAIPIVPLIIGAGLVQHMLLLSGGQQQNTNNDDDDDEFNKLLSDIFDFSALILNCGGFITARFHHQHHALHFRDKQTLGSQLSRVHVVVNRHAQPLSDDGHNSQSSSAHSPCETSLLPSAVTAPRHGLCVYYQQNEGVAIC